MAGATTGAAIGAVVASLVGVVVGGTLGTVAGALGAASAGGTPILKTRTVPTGGELKESGVERKSKSQLSEESDCQMFEGGARIDDVKVPGSDSRRIDADVRALRALQ